MLGARIRGFGAKNEYGENGGARGAIYRGQVGHRRGTRRNKGLLDRLGRRRAAGWPR
jgi:hypothetical protein